MQLFKLTIFVLVFVAIRCRAKILISTANLDETTCSLTEDLVNIVKTCYGDQLHGVGLAGNLPDTLSRTLSNRHLIPVVLIDGTKKPNQMFNSLEVFTEWDDTYTALIRFRHKLSVFIVEASSSELLPTVLKNIENTIWKNRIASYFILDRSPGCVNAVDFLVAAWNLGFLNAKVMCHHHKSERIIVTVNLFTDKAPLPWQRDFKEYNSSYVSFSRKYGEHAAICVNLEFDKTKNLWGTDMIVEGVSPRAYAHMAITLRDYQFWSETDRVLTTIFRVMNITPEFTGHNKGDIYLRDEEIRVHNAELFSETGHRFMTYPREQIEKVLVSHKVRESSPNIIRPGTDIDSAFGLGIIYSITPFFFKWFIQQPLVTAFFNLIRIKWNMDSTNLSHNNARRIYLASLLLFAVAVQGMYQGHFACMLTTRSPRRNVDTMADVAELGYKTIYFNDFDKVEINEYDLREHFVAVYTPSECIKYTKRDSMTVCLWNRTPELLNLAQAFDLRVSSKSVTSTYVAFDIHEDSPLERQINVVIGRLAEADLLRHRDVSIPTRFADYRLAKSESNTHRKNNNFEKITLRELTFAFAILSSGLACATITLIAEIVIRYKCKIVRRHITNEHV